MKKFTSALAIGVLLAGINVPQTDAGPWPYASAPHFYAELAPHGIWVQMVNHGWVWRPHVAIQVSGWRPYCHAGAWSATPQGWTWQSSYTWGHIPFHYGRWVLTTDMGWVWVPGTEWSPAWVCWRTQGDYLGWAPLPPGCSSDTLTWSSTTDGGFRFDLSLGLGDNHYTFVHRDRLYGCPVEQAAIPYREARSLYPRSHACHRGPEAPVVRHERVTVVAPPVIRLPVPPLPLIPFLSLLAPNRSHHERPEPYHHTAPAPRTEPPRWSAPSAPSFGGPGRTTPTVRAPERHAGRPNPVSPAKPVVSQPAAPPQVPAHRYGAGRGALESVIAGPVPGHTTGFEAAGRHRR